jgi:hypothetical protein
VRDAGRHPALLTNAERSALLRQLEQHYLSTLDDNLLFAC